MKDEIPRPEINMASIRVDGGFVGLIFVLGTMAIFIVGIPAIRCMLPVSAVLGCGVALVLHFRHRG